MTFIELQAGYEDYKNCWRMKFALLGMAVGMYRHVRRTKGPWRFYAVIEWPRFYRHWESLNSRYET